MGKKPKNPSKKVIPENRHDFSFSGIVNLGEIIGKIADIRDIMLK